MAEVSMNYYTLEYTVVDDFINRRAPYRPAHLQLVRDAHARGEILLAGALGDPPDGVLMIFRGESPRVAEGFAENDPYVANGFATSWRVRPWNVVVGREP
jgi:uncharacterized protein YciI